MIRFVPIAALVALLFSVVPATALASQPAPTGCVPGVVTQFDMAGRYYDDQGNWRLEIFPCGGSSLSWFDDAGRMFGVAYGSTKRMQGGGYISTTLPEFYNGGPWQTNTIGIKPAERGAIQIIFVLSNGEVVVRHGWRA